MVVTLNSVAVENEPTTLPRLDVAGSTGQSVRTDVPKDKRTIRQRMGRRKASANDIGYKGLALDDLATGLDTTLSLNDGCCLRG